jgi:PAS domain S-box-containing protein
MTPEPMQTLSEYGRDNIAFKLLPQILSAIETNYERSHQQIHFQASLLDQLCNAIIATDIKGNIIYWNRFAQKLYQWKAEEVIGRNIYNVIIPHDRRQLAQTMLFNLKKSKVWQGDLIVQRKNGSSLVVDVTQGVIQDNKGEVKGFVSIYIDATERKQAEIALKQSEATLKAIFDSTLQAVVLIDREQKIKAFNKTANEWILKIYNQRLVEGNSIYDFVSKEDVKYYQRNFSRAIQGELIKTEKSFQSVNGDNYSFEITYCPVYDENETVIGVCQIAVNIDRQRKAIDELAKSEERFRSLVQNSSDIITVLEADGTINYVSPSVERILGYKPEEVVGNNAFEYIHPQETLSVKEKFTEILKQPGLVLLSEIKLRHGADKWIYVEVAVNNLLEEASTKGVVVNCRDITERKQAEALLQQQFLRDQALNVFTRKLRSYLDIETICAIATKEISQMLQVDCVEIQQYLLTQEVWLTVAEYPKHTGVSSSIGVEVPDVDNEISRKIKKLEVVKIEDSGLAKKEANDVVVCPPDFIRWLLVPLHFQQRLWGRLNLMMTRPPQDWQGWEVEWVCAIADQLAIAIQQAQVYQQSSALNADLEWQVQERTAELEQKVKELQELNVLKDDFLSTVSHELRTPLANMKMAIQMLKIATTSDRRQRYLEILESECGRETELINDLLDLQRLEVANYSLTLETINLQSWLPNIIEPFFSRTTEHQQILEVNLPADLPPIVSDRTSLGRIIAELLNNACKYTSSGDKIIFSARCDREVAFSAHRHNSNHTQDTSKVMSFAISNQAEIPAAALPRIFEKFYRVPNADPWKRGGTGLGLALVQKLIEQMEGTIQVKSSSGWTTFTVQIPTRPSEQLRAKGSIRLI